MPSVAIIEDEKSILDMYTLKFESAGFTVYSAVNGEEGLELLAGVKPDIILLDLMMPVMNGTAMLQKLRSLPWGKDLPVIILSNVSEDEAPHELTKLGIQSYIVKAGSTPQTVLEKVQQILAQ